MTKSPDFFAVYSDIGAGKYGTTEGVALLADHLKRRYPTATLTQIKPTPTDLPAAPLYQNAKNIEHLTPFFQDILTPALTKGFALSDKAGNFPIVVSGDHSNAIGTVSAFLNHNQDKRVGVVWIDAHADMHSVYTTPSGNVHGMSLAAVMRFDNAEAQVGLPCEQSKTYWDTLKGLSQHAKGVQPSDVFFLGLRSFEPPETHLIKQHNIFAYSAAEHRRNFERVLETLKQRLAEMDAVYVSFDVDALDENLVPATGTPEPNGYSVEEMKAIFDVLLTLPNTRLFELTEFNPTLDGDTAKYETITHLLDYAIAKACA